MYVSQPLSELSDYSSLVAESLQVSKDWDSVLITSLAGRDGRLPGEDEADRALSSLADRIGRGVDLSGYSRFDRDGSPVQSG